MKFDIVIIGAGISGAVLAERFANEENKKVLIIEKKDHIGGHVYDFYNNDHILIQKYGPHIFHTNNDIVWEYLSKFTDWLEFKHKVLTYVNGKTFPIPINLNTINNYFGIKLRNERELKLFLDKKRDKKIEIPKNSREVILCKFGEEIYNDFIKNYTKKQWDMYPEELDKEVLERLPIRYNKNPYYFNDKYQGVPKFGYTKMIKKMLSSKNIKILLKTDYRELIEKINYNKLFVTSPIDEFFDYKFGKMKYRCVKFKFETFNKNCYQKNSVINYPNDYNFTRITEMKKITFQKCRKTTICKEIPSWEGEPSYPIPCDHQKNILLKYEKEALIFKKIYFTGRLGTYKYINMDVAVENSLNLFKKLL